MSRFVIYGAGAVGGAIGAELSLAGSAVLLVARGAQKAAIEQSGLRYVTPSATVTLELPVVEHAGEIDFHDDDVVIVSVKTQDSIAVFEALAAVAPKDLPIVCAQNGVANEEFALRSFPNVYGMACFILATYLTPGEVVLHAAPTPGVFHLGRWPNGDDPVATNLAEAFTAAGFLTYLYDDVRPVKYRKLLGNLVNAAQAVLEPDVVQAVAIRARAEGVAVYEAAGIAYMAEDEILKLNAPWVTVPVPGHERSGGSTWQSLARGASGIEADYLSGEIVLRGRLHGVPTPVNALLQRLANAALREGRAPGYLSETAFEQLLALG